MAYTEEQRRAIHARAKERLRQMKEQPQPQPQQPDASVQWGTKKTDRTELDVQIDRYMAGDRHALDLPDEPRQPPVVLNAGEHLVRREHQRQRPVFDEATQKLWDDWFKTSFDNHIKRHIDFIYDELEKGIEAHNKGVKFVDDYVVKAREKREQQIAEVREEMRLTIRKEVAAKVKTLRSIFKKDRSHNTANVTDIGTKRKV